MVVFSVVGLFLGDEIGQGVWWAVLLLVLPLVTMLALLIIIARQPRDKGKLHFQVRMPTFSP